MRLVGKFTAIVSCTMAVAAMGVVYAGTASANASANYMCVNANDGGGDICAFGARAVNSEIEMIPWASNWAPQMLWHYPTNPTSYAKISQDGTNLCMQLDHNAGNLIIEATCSTSTPSYQEWLPVATYNGDIFVSKWQANPTLCLTYNANQGYLDAVTCNKNAWYQQFFN
jgi:hypothetical protein